MEMTTPSGKRAARMSVQSDPGMEGMGMRPDTMMMMEPEQQTMSSAIDRCDNEIENYQDLLERLHHKLSPILNAFDQSPSAEPRPSGHDDSVSDIRNVFGRQADRLTGINDGLRSILARIDL